MGANDKVPEHYQSTYMHWDFAIRIGLNYLEACTTKYVTRWRKKDGTKDLGKADHYLDKLMEVEVAGENIRVRRDNVAVDEELTRFSKANNLDPLESQYMFILCTYQNVQALKNAHQILKRITTKAQEPKPERIYEVYGPGTPEDGGHHSRQED